MKRCLCTAPTGVIPSVGVTNSSKEQVLNSLCNVYPQQSLSFCFCDCCNCVPLLAGVLN